MKKKYIALITLAVTSFSFFLKCSTNDEAAKPNIVLILTDDQGIGDIGYNGNKYIQTPTLDKLASESIKMTNFYVSPVCAPTRASIMTGRYSERTGIYDTYNGGATMAAGEITIAEILKENGYSTGIFGKWHLGDNYPHRPSEQGFDESLIHKGGGIGQPGDIVNLTASHGDLDSNYFNPVLYKNNIQIKMNGYCTDIFTEKAIEFIKTNKGSPFFVLLSFNAPHVPLQVPDKYLSIYNNININVDDFIESPPLDYYPSEDEIDNAKRVYAMMSNIDENIYKLVNTLDQEELSQNTIFIYMSDNGPQNRRYKMGLKDTKGTVYEGGIKVPFFIKYPYLFKDPGKVDEVIAHIDLFPTLLELCNIDNKSNVDGISFVDLMNKKGNKNFNERTLFFEWTRGMPRAYHNVAARRGDFKLVGNTDYDSDILNFELYNIKNDPFEKINLIETEIDIAIKLKSELDAWYDEIKDEPNNRISHPAIIGTEFEDPVILNRNDAKGYPPVWRKSTSYGSWDVKVLQSSKFNFTFNFIDKIEKAGSIYLRMYPHHYSKKYEKKDIKQFVMEGVNISSGSYSLEAFYLTVDQEYITPLSIGIEKIN